MKMALFDDLVQGFDDLKAEREGKITLKTHQVHASELKPLNANELKEIRSKLNLSQSVFARCLHIPVRTYQGWEQGEHTPNKQATVLIRLVDKHPEAVEMISSL
ncbi:transcriptional regulator [Zooshikella ganghwensis]|uniref:Transcriptional regulator n=2 Tax=Zooshikella ganghwensis TaxID=202772 RepID=A0A4P9VFY7_9GAMM|nr:transcriptional regulator [Zooshikella ganghwensis]